MNEDQSLIMTRLHQFSEGYANRDLSAVLATFSRKLKATIVFGTGCEGPLMGLEPIRERLTVEFAQRNDFQLRVKWMNLDIVGRVAWITAISEAASALTQASLVGRFTAILVQEPAGWFIAHLHFSFPLQPSGAENLRLQPIEDYIPAHTESASHRGNIPSGPPNRNN